VIKPPERKRRRLAAIDETVIKLEDKQVFVWVAININTRISCMREEVELRHILSLEIQT